VALIVSDIYTFALPQPPPLLLLLSLLTAAQLRSSQQACPGQPGRLLYMGPHNGWPDGASARSTSSPGCIPELVIFNQQLQSCKNIVGVFPASFPAG
jgi:hypothetical protein